MYPCYFDAKAAETPEILAFWADCEAVGAVNDLDGWYITSAWAERFRRHLETLTPLAEGGNPLAQYNVAAILMIGYCYTSAEEMLKSFDRDAKEMTKWLVRAARQGYMIAVDNLIAAGVGPEAERVRSIYNELQDQIKNGEKFPIGETYRRAYGAPILESRNEG